MNKTLHDAYDKYHELGFVLGETERHKKFAYVKGAYKDRANQAFDEDATGYYAIIPPSIIIVDNDLYEEGNEFDKFVKDLGYTPEPFAITPSGGEHYAFENPYPDMITGKTDYSKVDIFGGYQSVIPIVGTTVKNKQGNLAEYQWADDNYEEEIIVNKASDPKELFKLRERGEDGEGFEIEDDLDYLELFSERNTDMPDAEVDALLESMPENMDYDSGWLKVGMALYDRYLGGDDGKAKWHKYSKRSSEKYDEDYTEKKWVNGNLKGSKITYKTLRSIAHEGELAPIKSKIKDAKSAEELEEVIQDIASKKQLNTTSKLDQDVRKDLADEVNLKYKELKADGKVEKVEQARKILKQLTPTKEIEMPKGFDVYRLNNKYIIRHNDKVVLDVTTGMLSETLSSLGIKIPKDAMAKYKQSVPTVSSYKEIPDYTLETQVRFGSEEQGGTKLPAFVVRFNPLYGLEEIELDEEIIDDFFGKVWGGKLYDIVTLVGLTLKFKETKLNRLMVIAPSNAGKSEIFTHMNFQKINMGRLLNGMRADKGVGSNVIDGIKASGLLLIDEANKALEAEIKDMDKELQIDQFGSGGTQILPLHFTALTSTHSNATRNNSDELYNRFLQVELHKRDMEYTIVESPLFRADSARYSKHIEAGLMQMMKNTILSDATIHDLYELQEKYRLPLNTDLEELLYEIGQDFIADVKSSASEQGTVVVKNGSYFYKRKSDATAYFENKLGEIDAIDVGKYAELLTKHFIGEERKSVKLNNRVIKYYPIVLTPYTEDEDKIVEDMFDDLDIKDL